MSDHEEHRYDVLIVGAGGAGLRAAIAAREEGLRVAIICKSLFGKAHTVMAEGGIAASMGNVNSNDSWQVHFRDTMRGGKFLNNPRMAELHAQEAPATGLGAGDLRRAVRPHPRRPDQPAQLRRPRVPAAGPRRRPHRPRADPHPAAEDRLAAPGRGTGRGRADAAAGVAHETLADEDAGLRVFAEVTITELLTDASGAIAGAFGYRRETGTFVVFRAPAVILATGGIGKSFKVTSNSWEYTGDGHALALRAGSTLINMEFVQFHPTGMVWPPSVKGILVTESVRGDGGVLRNSEGKRFMFNYVPEIFRAKYADTEEEGDRWYSDPEHNLRPPELLPRDEVARAINSEVKAGRGTEHGGVFLDVSTRLPADVIIKKLPSMHHQFRELADVDITKQPMEVGPTCHYVMGGVEVDPDTAAARNVPGLFAAGEVSGGMHGSNRLGGNSLSDLLVFGRRAGVGAADYVRGLGDAVPEIQDGALDVAAAEALAPFQPAADGGIGENPYTIHRELQQVMNDLVGIIRKEDEMQRALDAIDALKARVPAVSVEGHRQFNPGWHLALDLRNMLLVSECVARAALARQESRGGHTRDDYPGMNAEWRRKLLVCSMHEGRRTMGPADRPASPSPRSRRR